MSELSDIKSMLKAQNDEHKKQSEKLDDIHFAIFGNRQAGVKGMAKIQEDHAKKIAEYDRFKWIATGATLSGFAGTIAWIKQHFGI